MRMILPGFGKSESAAVAQTAETPIVAVRTRLGVFRRNVQPRQNLPDNVLLAEDALVCEKREFAALRVVSHTTPGEFFVFAVGSLPTPRKFCPVINMAALMNCEVAVPPCSGERC